MAQTIQFRRGNEANLPSLAPGEPAVALDTKKVFIGSTGGNIEITKKDLTLLNVKDFGAKGDGSTDDTQAFKDALAAGKWIFIPEGVYVISDTLELDEHHLVGTGVDKWVPSFIDQTKEESVGTHLRFVGTGPKRYAVKDTTDMRLAGGWRTNGSSANAEDTHYKLLNFMNEDANGTTPATEKKFSVAIYVKPTTQNWSIQGLRIYPSYNGLEGYNQKSAGLADNWDVGLMVDSAEFGVTDNFQSVGYWRVASLVLSHARNTTGTYEAGAEHNKFIRSMFQGFRGVSIRGGDYFRVTAVTASTIEIPWTSSNPIPSVSTETKKLRIGTTYFEWTGATQSGDKLTLTGVTPNPTTSGVSVGSTMRNNIYTTGLGGTVFQDCYICGLEHFSGKSSDELGLGLGVSAAIEGNNARGIRFTGSTKIATREQVMVFLLETDDWEFYGDLEPASWKKADGTSGNTGARFIATPLNVVDAAALYPAGNTNNLNIFGGYYSTDLDLAPLYTRETSRFTDGGMFQPREVFIQSKMSVGSDGKVKSPLGVSLTLRTGETDRIIISQASGSMYPVSDNTQFLGTSSNQFKAIYANDGFYVKTPDGTKRYKISVDNSGAIVSTLV